ncbi:MAG: UDP-N-acetylmuramate:L-alanyl-gamma-D-glutamyl-meso-diaminopimelate ligase [Desulfobacca sp.]|uniref:UDP-N-acetylmuramate:L-alanyl-gamma-D-glutamyl- meso-diaminopimelate ligase n=1 Tax=Desulfobacca sp. TaxID=2067990 RepID=UPI00404B3303
MTTPIPKPAHVHLLGICGTGMAALAGILQEQGFRVTGSDEHTYPPMSTFLERLGIPVTQGYRPEHLLPRPDLVVIGNVIRAENPEAQAVLQQGIPYLSMPAALNRYLVGTRQALVVSGTHGKTTTSSLLAWLLYAAGLDPGFMIGGIVKNFQANYRVGTGPYVVLEGDEYDTAFFDKRPKFLLFQPHQAILTSVEFDHADIYRDLPHVVQAFTEFVRHLPLDGKLLAWGDAPLVRQVAAQAASRVALYGLNNDALWQARSLTPQDAGMRFEVWRGGLFWEEFYVPLAGRHNVLNTLAALATLDDLGLDRQRLKEALPAFAGVKRRLEVAGEFDGITVVDDFAHHPTAVAETLLAARGRFPGRRLLVAFEPRTNTSRRRVFQQDYVRALAAADLIFVREPSDLWKAPEDDRFSSPQLVADLIQTGRRAWYFPDTDALLAAVLGEARPGDVILVMSNGGFDGLVGRLGQTLGQREVASRRLSRSV